MNVKQGDLAIVINTLNGIGLGMVVTVSEYAGHSPAKGHAWRVIAARDVNVFNPITGGIRTVPAGSAIVCPDDWLRPISGLPLEDETDTRIPEVA